MHPANSTWDLPGTIHRPTQFRLNQRGRQQVCLYTAQKLLRYSLYTTWLPPAQGRTLLHQFAATIARCIYMWGMLQSVSLEPKFPFATTWRVIDTSRYMWGKYEEGQLLSTPRPALLWSSLCQKPTLPKQATENFIFRPKLQGLAVCKECPVPSKT